MFSLARISLLDAAEGDLHGAGDDEVQRVVRRGLVDRPGDAGQGAIEVLPAVMEDGPAVTEPFRRTQHALGMRPFPVRVGTGQDAVVVEMDEAIPGPTGREDGQRDGGCGPIVRIVVIAIGAPRDAALESASLEGSPGRT